MDEHTSIHNSLDQRISENLPPPLESLPRPLVFDHLRLISSNPSKNTQGNL